MRHTISDDNHSLAAAVRNSGMDEDQLWFIVRFAAEHGYDKAIRMLSPRSTVSRARRWLVWVGGWESSALSILRGEPAWRTDRDPFPVSILGHRATFFGASFAGTDVERHWWQVRVAGGYLVGRWRSWLYWSPDGTPGHPDAFNIIGNHCPRERRAPADGSDR